MVFSSYWFLLNDNDYNSQHIWLAEIESCTSHSSAQQTQHGKWAGLEGYVCLLSKGRANPVVVPAIAMSFHLQIATATRQQQQHHQLQQQQQQQQTSSKHAKHLTRKHSANIKIIFLDLNEAKLSSISAQQLLPGASPASQPAS